MSLRVRNVFGVGAWRSLDSPPRRRFGVPPGGPWDPESARIAAAFAGAPHTREVFELLQGTAEFEATEDGMVAAVGVGQIQVGGKDRALSMRFPVKKGDVVQVRGHLAYTVCTPHVREQAKLDWNPPKVEGLRYLPHQDSSAEEMTLSVSPASNRAGIRLVGLSSIATPELPSEPSCVGAIQQTPGGELIVIGPDGPTIGGYPKIGYVIEADLPRLPRLRIGQDVRLIPTTWDLAIAKGCQNRSELEMLLRNLQLRL